MGVQKLNRPFSDEHLDMVSVHDGLVLLTNLLKPAGPKVACYSQKVVTFDPLLLS